jgi:hypothetical protein
MWRRNENHRGAHRPESRRSHHPSSTANRPSHGTSSSSTHLQSPQLNRPRQPMATRVSPSLGFIIRKKRHHRRPLNTRSGSPERVLEEGLLDSPRPHPQLPRPLLQSVSESRPHISWISGGGRYKSLLSSLCQVSRKHPSGAFQRYPCFPASFS